MSDKYYHGARVIEEPTPLATPVEGTAGLQVIFGTAPVNLAADPCGAVNRPVLCRSFSECVTQFGYSTDFRKFTLCQSMNANFRVFAVAPVILVNVLDPRKHVKENGEKQYTVVNRQALVTEEGILLDSLVVKNGEEILSEDTDYITSFDDSGYVVVTLLDGGAGAGLAAVTVTGRSIDPSAVTKKDIIGGYDEVTGEETGLETVRQVYPEFGMTPGLLLAPGWSQDREVAAVLMEKCRSINGLFRCECLIDLDTEKARKYTECGKAKEESGIADPHAILLWPMVQIGELVYAYSAVYGALVARTDAENDDVPNRYPSNIPLGISGAVTADGTKVRLDQNQANVLNGSGIVTALNDSGWKSWGNNTSVYPESRDPKDRWIACRRFFSWWGNSFILTYKDRVDNPMNSILIEAVCDSENIRGNSYVSQGKCAGARIEYLSSDNTTDDILNGKLTFRQHIAPYTPAEDIVNILSFDTETLRASMEGGE